MFLNMKNLLYCIIIFVLLAFCACEENIPASQENNQPPPPSTNCLPSNNCPPLSKNCPSCEQEKPKKQTCKNDKIYPYCASEEQLISCDGNNLETLTTCTCKNNTCLQIEKPKKQTCKNDKIYPYCASEEQLISCDENNLETLTTCTCKNNTCLQIEKPKKQTCENDKIYPYCALQNTKDFVFICENGEIKHQSCDSKDTNNNPYCQKDRCKVCSKCQIKCLNLNIAQHCINEREWVTKECPKDQQCQDKLGCVLIKPQNKQAGLLLDTARRHYKPETIKRFIDLIAEAGGDYLQWHFSDNENYNIESTFLGQTVQTATLNEDGSYTNPKTGKPFISKKMVQDLVAYARSKSILLYPELDTPAHMKAIFTLAELKKMDLSKIRSTYDEQQLLYEFDDGKNFVKQLLEEVLDTFKPEKYIHLGGDEFNHSLEDIGQYIEYMNILNAFLKNKGLRMRIWNDGLKQLSFSKENEIKLNKDIEITYWSYDGKQGPTEKTHRMSLPELLDLSYTIHNYQFDYLYYCPNPEQETPATAKNKAKFIRENWRLGDWEPGECPIQDHRLAGAAISIWSEDAKDMTDEQIFDLGKERIQELIKKLKPLSKPQ